MRISYHGHSCLLVETDGARVLIDPGTFSDLDALTRDSADLDAILVTHQHPDHLDVDRLPALLQANPRAVLRTDPETAQQLREKGIPAEQNVAGDTVTIGDIEVTGVGRQHAEIHRWLDPIANVGLVLRADGTSLFHPGDALDADPGRVDYVAVPVSAPWCAVKETIDFVRETDPQVAIIPIHDALLQPGARALYLRHIGDFGQEGGVEVIDLTGGEPRELAPSGSIA